MAEKLSKEETYVNAIHYATRDWAVVQAVVTIGRTLGYIPEMEYSKMMTLVVRGSGTVRSDGAETIELARNPRLTTMQEYPWHHDPEVLTPLSKAIRRPQNDETLSEQLKEEILPSES